MTEHMYEIEEGIVAVDSGEGAVLYRADDEMYFGLNTVGAFVYSLLDSSKSLSEIGAAVAKEFKISEEEIRTEPASARSNRRTSQKPKATRPRDTRWSWPPRAMRCVSLT